MDVALTGKTDKAAMDKVDKLLEEIAHALRFLDWFFTLEEAPVAPINATVFYRSMKKSLSSKRVQSKRWLHLIARQYTIYGDHVALPETNLQRFDGDFESLTDEDIEELATNTRRYWGRGDGRISNLTLLLENNGIIITHIDLDTQDLDACSTTWYGRCFILINTTKSTCSRVLANLAHELGHLILHSSVSPDILQKHLELIEKQAWRFFSAFLLPASTFFNELVGVSLSSFGLLKPRWRTSFGLMIMRSGECGIIDDYKKTYLFTEMSRKGYRRHKPFDDTLRVETPHLLLDVDKLLIESGRYSRDRLSHRVALDPEVYCAIIGAETTYIQPIQRKPVLRLVWDIEQATPAGLAGGGFCVSL